MTPTQTPPTAQVPSRLVFVTGASGAGRSTAIATLEDLGHEVIDNLPLSLLPRLLDGPPMPRPLALGIDVRNRDFGADSLAETIDRLARDPALASEVLFLDCREDVLVRRYSETRRRHPMARGEGPADGIRREMELLAPIRDRADILIDTSDLSPHDLRDELARRFTPDGGALSVSVQSFSYKRGLPRNADVVLDVRFLRNPHWDDELRHADGRDPRVGAYVAADPRFDDFFDRVSGLALSLLPAYRDEGKAYLTIALGCTGGQHRSVYLAERLGHSLAAAGWSVAVRHREIERRAGLAAGRATGDRA